MTEVPQASPSRAIHERLHERMAAPDPEDTKAIIDRYKLKRIDAAMPISRYISETFARQHFIRTYARAQVSAANNQNALGMWWVVLNPTLNAMIYWLIFGKILGQENSVENYIAFVVIGVFSMEFIAQCLSSGSNAITGNLGLVRALQFPRAVLPITMVLREFIEHLVAIGVMIGVVLITLEWPHLQWVGFPVILALMVLFSMSVAFVTARIGNAVQDFKNFVPFIARVWLMLSGAVFALQTTFGSYPQWAGWLLCANPAFSYLELSRAILMTDYEVIGPNGQSIVLFCWVSAFLWALVPLPLAFIFFWRGEQSYGKS